MMTEIDALEKAARYDSESTELREQLSMTGLVDRDRPTLERRIAKAEALADDWREKAFAIRWSNSARG